MPRKPPPATPCENVGLIQGSIRIICDASSPLTNAVPLPTMKALSGPYPRTSRLNYGAANVNRLLMWLDFSSLYGGTSQPD